LAILGESLRFAFQNIRANLMRTLLSLFGVTIGVFCIISIFTLVDSLEISIRDSISRFGDNVIFVHKWPWGFASDYPWWKYVNRPEIKYQDMLLLQKRFKGAEAICFSTRSAGEKLTIGNNSAEGVIVLGVTNDYSRIVALNYLNGRYFTDDESQRGDKVIILGYEVAKSLFTNPENALDQKIQVMNRKLRVIGVLNKEGKALGIGSDQDQQVVVPLSFVRSLSDVNGENFGPTIMVKGLKDESLDKLEDELRGAMRGVRKLGPWDDDNFALNRITIFTNFITQMFGKINFFGWIIAGFSILVGGFGIANIMFVSVKERTPIIGIQKSLGAKSYFILAQFLAESIFLCVLGGAIGLMLIFILSQLLNLVLPLHLVLTFKNIMIGIGISSVIGVLSGFIPSLQAANMDPIEAIRSSV
jgi:putative ABC transport system permease protein